MSGRNSLLLPGQRGNEREFIIKKLCGGEALLISLGGLHLLSAMSHEQTRSEISIRKFAAEQMSQEGFERL
jgi:hypothetical protein